MLMEIKLETSDDKGTFFIEENGQRLGEMVFSKYPDRILIEHTEVNEALQGKNAGKQLVAAGVEYARKNNLKVVPLCPFARKVFERVKEYGDVL
ncbi:MAG TPA: GNAT family N-acetyltransferase [Cyclobacteriaceae bacterium]|nr:GNAT family N-acetyltransferase [Cyclobacteriaceae bacterium]